MALKVGLRFREAITAYGNRGIARVESGDMEGAIQDFSEIIKRKPTNRRLLSTAYKNRALQFKLPWGGWPLNPRD